MPVQERSTVPVERGGGLVPPVHPMDGDVELRVHGVGGTPPAQLLSDLSPDQVAGDKIAGFYRTVDDEHDRHIEAYSWGGLTSRSSFRVLWILMLPFALSNLAGWMCQPSVARHKARFLVHRFIARAAGLLLTLNVVILLLMIGEDLIAVRCRGATTCTSRLPPGPAAERARLHRPGRRALRRPGDGRGCVPAGARGGRVRSAESRVRAALRARRAGRAARADRPAQGRVRRGLRDGPGQPAILERLWLGPAPVGAAHRRCDRLRRGGVSR